MSDEFYVGYLPQAPAGLARFVRGRVGLLLVVVALVGALTAAAMGPFARSRFEFGEPRAFEGWLRAEPVPTLLVRRPGAPDSWAPWLLVELGKFGADARAAELDGAYVRLEGTRIHRGDARMIELTAAAIQAVDAPPGPPPEARVEELGEVALVGEIVDSKCYLGVMKPGNLKPHRGCAARCLSGGVPPALVMRDERGHATYVVLSSTDGEPLGERVLDLVAEPVRAAGRLVRADGLLVLHTDPGAIERLDDPRP